MAVLGSLVDRVANAFTLGGATCQTAQAIFQTTPHSLGAAPDYIIPVLASFGPDGDAGGGANIVGGTPAIGGLRGNASLNTVFAGVATGQTMNSVISVDVIAVNVWSGAR